MTAVAPGQNVDAARRPTSGAANTLLAPGDLLTPGRLGVCAAAGRIATSTSTPARWSRWSRPATRSSSRASRSDRRRSTTSIASRCRRSVALHGGVARVLPSAPDDLPALTAMLVETTRSADIFVFSGGSSVGERDLVLDAMRQAGEVIFHGIAVKPGKPTALGRVNGRPVLGMPGNPTSCLSNAYLLLVPDAAPHGTPAGPSAAHRTRAAGQPHRLDRWTASVLHGADRDGAAVPAFKSSGDITSMSRADGYIELPAQTEVVEAGETVEVKLF